MNEMQCVNSETDSIMRSDVSEKRTRKPTYKGMMIVIERLQKERRHHFKQASKLRTEIKTLLASKENVSAVQHNFKRFKQLCQKASELLNKLLTQFSLPEEEQRRQETWFQFKRSNNDEFAEEILTWLKENGISYDDDDGGDENDQNEGDFDKNARSGCHDINPEDSVSNVPSKRSSRRSHSRSAMSSTSACLKAKAEKAALMQKAAALQRRHELEAQEEKLRQESDRLRKIKEQLDLDAQIAAAVTRLSVLEGSDVGGKASSN